MRELPRLPEGESADEKIRIIYDWLYELQMELKKSVTEENPSVSSADSSL